MMAESFDARTSARSCTWSRRIFLRFSILSAGLSLLPLPARPQAADLAFAHVTEPAAFNVAVRRAHARKMPVLAYFTAEWCPICNSIDRRMFSNPVIKKRLERIALVRADVTAVDAGNQALMEHHRVSGPPTMFFIDAKDGREVSRTRLTGAVDANLFLDTINLAGL